MTEKNKMLREKLKTIEVLANNCLHMQPDDDNQCEVHLKLSLAKIAEMSADYLGMTCVEAYDIVWDTDDQNVKDFGLPKSMMLSVAQCDIGRLGEEIADMISDRSGWCVKSCKYKVL